jgi:hypothetical protein
MQIQDLYKLIHQAAMGSEHAISSAQAAREWLKRELAEMGPGPEEPMIDPISADGQIVRVHLRPFVEGGGDPETLLHAFLRTANEYRGDRQVLEEHWHAATDIRHFPPAELDEFIEAMRVRKYPAVHHSTEYERLYRPAYRVVWRKFIL